MTATHAQRIANALSAVAELAEEDDAYIPLFQRLDMELSLAQPSTAAADRVRARLKNQMVMA
jgi:hypothetical protein